ncbi:MAG: aspartate aminotransferase family protein [Candidatus Hermodarchaeota archaeon]
MTVLSQELALFKETYPKSLAYWQKSLEYHPGGICHNIRRFGMSDLGLGPVVIKGGKGAYLVSVDGIELLDYWMGHYSLILGHSYQKIVDALKEQVTIGTLLGTLNPYQLDLAKLIIDATPGIEKLRFCTTGTEATMYAIRLARADTGRTKILKIKGGWHGGNDSGVFTAVQFPFDQSESTGLVDGKDILTIDWNDSENATKIIKQYRHELAGVIIEPVLGAGGALPPSKGFLESLRAETEKYGILLIFDEIITGFRLSYHSAQGFFGVTPDLTTLGKIVGGGMPIGVIGGKEEILDRAKPGRPNSAWIGGGTFSAHPMSMVAGRVCLEELRKKPEIYKKLENEGEKLRAQISDILERNKFPALATGIHSFTQIHHLTKELSPDSLNATKLNQYHNKKAETLFHLILFNRKIHAFHGLGALSSAHQSEDINKTLTVIEEAVKLVSKASK